MTQLTPIGLIAVSGSDAKKFLQGQLTCNLDDITPTQTRLAAHCNPQGRIISLFRLFMLFDTYYLQMPLELIPIALAALKKYSVFFKTELRDVSEQFMQVGCSGDSIATVFTTLPNQINEAQLINNLIIINVPSEEPRYEIMGPINEMKTFQEILSNHQMSYNNWKYLNIKAGIPAIYPATSEKFLPHDLNLPELHAVSFQKGCFTGQEIIARMQYRGKLKNHLYRASVKTEKTPELGQDIYQNSVSCGSIVDYCQIDSQEYELLVIASQNDVTSSTSLSLFPEKKAILNFYR